ncbi:DMT family transporter [Deinococcus sp. YIM 134068]|uniref:DMT family transporter n=1 Tax=Deinococcus lichenicola TaxID=3118910 RepID=UPI002F956DA8
MLWLPVLLALLAGAVVPLQASANARLALAAGHPAWGALTNALLTATLLGTFVLLFRPGHPAGLLQNSPPWWAWLGGAFGAAYLLGLTALAPRLGTATLLSLIVLGQLLVAGVLEHFGWLGVRQHALSPGRLLGLTLVVLGVVLVRRF